ncbi:unnamed protein product [Cuscuta campestris]|uniref:BED-type domain-containing protein n=1 Tax=Cuscuta campestris TaxID=132261 RepID=A0A484KG50_9ASTE|nr:unnamed protein product [Cuscuta campestris]
MVWNHFDRVLIDENVVAICHGCNKNYAGGGKSGTTHLKNHLNSCLQSKKKVIVRQQLIQASFKKDPNMPYVPGKFKFSREVSRMELGNMIVLHEYPLSSVDHIGFRRYSASLNPEFKVLSRNTIKADILKAFNEEKSFLKKRLSSIEGRVAITTDMCKGIEKVRDLVVYWVATPKRYEKFKSAVRYCKIPETKRLILEYSKTRWNSTYEMLEIALLYKDAFYRLRQSLKNEKFVLPDESEWEKAREVCDKLVVFSKKRGSLKRSEENIPSSNVSNVTRDSSDLDDMEWERHVSTMPRKKRLRSQVDVYLDDDVMIADPEKFNILVYWSTCKDNALGCSSIFVDEDVQEENINEEDGDVESDEDDI